MSLFMAVEETGTLMRVDIQSAADDVLEKWILCGDPDQIESVGCGSVFRDLLNSNTFCTVTLNQFMRQDAQSSIVQNCKKILEGNPDLIADEQFLSDGMSLMRLQREPCCITIPKMKTV